MKLEHVRMRMTHEPITSDLIDMELIELKFIFDRSASREICCGLFSDFDFQVTLTIGILISFPTINPNVYLHCVTKLRYSASLKG